MDETSLFNLALDSVGARNKISLPSEQSREAEACNLWYPNIRDQVLASASWPEATKMERLALFATQDDDLWTQGEPRPDLLNAYSLPSDLLRPQNLTDYSKFAVQSYGQEKKALMTSTTSPILIYTFRQKLISMWSHELQMAIMYGVAASICVPLTGKTSRAKVLLQQANEFILNARESAANVNDERMESLPEWIVGRGYSDTSTRSRYYYPFAGLLTVNVS